VIVATVGTQLPFFRLIKALDAIARENSFEIVAQTFENCPDAEAIDQRPFLSPDEFESLASRADLIVGHAGIGTIISAERLGKPLVLFPRRASLGEHRNEHQLATVKAMSQRKGIHIAWDEAQLGQLLTGSPLSPLVPSEAPSKGQLLSAIADFISGAEPAAQG